MYERQLLRELEALLPDIANAANKHVPITNGVPRPTVIPPLEDYSSKPIQRTGTVPPMQPQASSRPPPIQAPPVASAFPRREPLSASALPPPPRQPMHSPSSSQSFIKQGPSSSILPSTSTRTGQQDSLSANSVESLPRQTQSSVSSPSTPSATLTPTTPAPPLSDDPPLGGRYIESSKSMIIKSTSSPLSPSGPLSASSTFSPSPVRRGHMAGISHSATLGRASTSPLTTSSARTAQHDVVDPLGQMKPTLMTSSVRVQPTRSRLDAREAASKLANMF